MIFYTIFFFLILLNLFPNLTPISIYHLYEGLTHTHKHIHAHNSKSFIYTNIYIYIYICVCVYMCVCVCVCVCVIIFHINDMCILFNYYMINGNYKLNGIIYRLNSNHFPAQILNIFTIQQKWFCPKKRFLQYERIRRRKMSFLVYYINQVSTAKRKKNDL